MRIFVGVTIGLLAGTVVGAASFGLSTSTAEGSGMLGHASNLWAIAAFSGAIFGAICGLSLGLFITLLEIRLMPATSLGFVVGLISVLMISNSHDPDYSRFRTVSSKVVPPLLSLISWTLLGFFLHILTNKTEQSSHE